MKIRAAVQLSVMLFSILLSDGPANAQRTVMDAAGRKVTIPANVRKVMAAGPPASILVLSLAPETLSGWTRPLTHEEKGFLPPAYASLPVTGRLTGKGGTTNLESLLSSGVDVIIDYGDVSRVYADLADRIQEQTGIPYVLLDGKLRSTPAAYRLLGSVLGQEAKAEALARYCEEILDSVSRRAAAIPAEKRPRVYFGRGPKGLETAVPGSVTTEALDLLGVTNVASGVKAGKLVSVSFEQVLAWNPDWILSTDPAFAAAVPGDPLWKSLPAVKKGNFRLSPLYPFPWLDSPPSVNRLLGLVWLGKLLFPATFNEDLPDVAAAFHEKVYHRRPSPSQLSSLLSPAKTSP